jgi:hypothetical protein
MVAVFHCLIVSPLCGVFLCRAVFLMLHSFLFVARDGHAGLFEGRRLRPGAPVHDTAPRVHARGGDEVVPRPGDPARRAVRSVLKVVLVVSSLSSSSLLLLAAAVVVVKELPVALVCCAPSLARARPTHAFPGGKVRLLDRCCCGCCRCCCFRRRGRCVVQALLHTDRRVVSRLHFRRDGRVQGFLHGRLGD